MRSTGSPTYLGKALNQQLTINKPQKAVYVNPPPNKRVIGGLDKREKYVPDADQQMMSDEDEALSEIDVQVIDHSRIGRNVWRNPNAQTQGRKLDPEELEDLRYQQRGFKNRD